jgi:hypothetical protein
MGIYLSIDQLLLEKLGAFMEVYVFPSWGVTWFPSTINYSHVTAHVLEPPCVHHR